MPYRFTVLCLVSVSLITAQEGEKPSWKAAAAMGVPRTGHCAIGISGGRVLIAGGRDADKAVRSTEVYGPDDKFAAAAPLNQARIGHTCTLLDDGRVAVAGGSAVGGAEIWDPVANTWTEATGDAFPNFGHTATKLDDGRVLLAGGAIESGLQGTLAIYDPAANEIRRLDATLMDNRRAHVAARLSDGRVLLAGGEGVLAALRSAEIFDPNTETIWPAAAMGLRRARAGAAALSDGRILVVAGTDFTDDFGNAELYLEAENRWEWISPPMWSARRSPFVTLLPSGHVLIAGGDQAGQPLGDTEIFDPVNVEFQAIGSLTAPRTAIAGAIIPDSAKVLATGGTGLSGPSGLCGTIIASESSLRTQIGARITADFDAGDTVTAVGSGFKNGSPVNFTLTTKEGAAQSGRLLSASTLPQFTAFSVPVFRGDASDFGKSFVLTASQGAGGTSLNTSFSVRNRVLITGGPTAASSFAGTSITFSYTLAASATAGTLGGSVTLTIGPLSRTFTLLAQAAGTEIRQSICCVAAPGSYSASIRYNGDAKHQAAATVGVPHTVNPVVLQLTQGITSLPLFEEIDVPLTVSLPDGTPAGQPAPAGTLTISGAGVGPLALTLSPAARGNASSASFRFRATFASRPSACFSGQYSGDARYPAQAMNVCVPVGLGRTTLQVTPATAEYSFGQLLPLSVKLTFPAEIGIANRQIAVIAQATAANGQIPDGTSNTVMFGEGAFVPLLNVGTGQASVDLTTAVQFNRAAVSVSYPGGGDLLAASVQIPLRMRLLTTQIVLRPIPSPSFQPLTLNVFLTGCPVGSDCIRIPSPTGTIRFFDGDVQLGEVPLAGSGAGTALASFSNVTRPPGIRQFRATYAGDSLYAPAASASIPVTVQ